MYTGSADSLEYRVRSPGGRLLRSARVPGHDLTLSPGEIETEREAYPSAPPGAKSMIQEVLALQPDRTHRPAYSRMVVDVLRYVWLQGYQGRHEMRQPAEWNVFSPDGRWLGGVTLPPRFEVFRIGRDWILGRAVDGLDVQHVQLLGLSRHAGAR